MNWIKAAMMILASFHSADPSVQFEHVVETACESNTVLLSEHCLFSIAFESCLMLLFACIR